MNTFRHLGILLCIGTILLLAPHVLRAFLAEGTPYGDDIYVLSGPAEYFTSLLAAQTGLAFALRYIPFVLGMLTIFFGYFVMRAFSFSSSTLLSTFLILISSPPFLYVFSNAPDMAFTLFWIILALFGMQKNSYLTTVPLFLLSFSGVISFLCALLIGAIYWYYHTKDVRILYGLALSGVGIVLFAFSPWHISEISLSTIAQQVVSDFGSPYGLGVFHILLLFYGIVISWRRKQQFVPFYLLLFLCIVSALFFDLKWLFLFLLPAGLFMGIGYIGVQSRTWRLELIKEFTILIITCGLVFSSISFLNRVAYAEPSGEFLDGLALLQQMPSSYVLSDALYSRQISAHTGMEPYLEGDIERLLKSKEIFSGKNIYTTLSLLEKEGIGYIVLHTEMRSRIWQRSDEGLLFLLQNEQAFVPLLKNDFIEIYRVNYDVE